MRQTKVSKAFVKVIKAVSIAAAAVWGLYLVAVHLFLWTGWLAQLLNSTGDVTLKHGWAFSPWPGKTYAHDFSLSIHDNSIQMQIECDYAEGSINLIDMFSRTVHLSHVKASPVSFHIRLLRKPGELSPGLLDQLPAIDGADSVIKKKEGSKSNPDDLWKAQIDDISAHLKDIWIDRYHYLGKAAVRGGLYYAPMRSLRVSHTLFRTRGGKIVRGKVVLATKADIWLSGGLEWTDFALADRWSLIRKLSAKVVGDFQFASNAKFRPTDTFMILPGNGRLRLSAKIEDGVAQDGSYLNYEAKHAGLGWSQISFTAETTLRYRQSGKNGNLKASLEHLQVIQNALKQKDTKDPVIRRIALISHVHIPDKFQPEQLIDNLEGKGSIDALSIPSLKWFNPWLKNQPLELLSGHIIGSANFRIKKNLRLSSDARFVATQAAFDGSKLASSADIKGQVSLHYESKQGNGKIEHAELNAKDWQLNPAKKTAINWAATLSTQALSFKGIPPQRINGTIKLVGKSVEPFLRWFIEPALLRNIASGALSMGKITSGAFRIHKDSSETNIEIRYLRDGNLNADGNVKLGKKGKARGKVNIQAGPIEVEKEIGATE